MMNRHLIYSLGIALFMGMATSGFAAPTTLSEGDAVPSVVLQNQDNQPTTIGAPGDKAVVMTFIFSRCPVPSFCPAMSMNFAKLQEAMRKDPLLAGKVQLISVSIDPEYDTPEILKRYAEHFAIDTSDWSFVTGKPEDVAKLTAAFSVFIDKSVEGAMDHTLTTALIRPDGTIQKLWRDNQWTPEKVLQELRVTFDPASDKSKDKSKEKAHTDDSPGTNKT